MKTKSKAIPERKTSVFQEVYPIHEPYVYAAVVTEPNTQRIKYEVIEPTLLKEEEKQLKEIKDILVEEIDVNLKEIGTRKKAEEYLKASSRTTASKSTRKPWTNSCTTLYATS